jgi:hypothetical protein
MFFDRFFPLKYNSPTVTHGKTFVVDFCSCELLRRAYLKGAKVYDKSFAMCNGR